MCTMDFQARDNNIYQIQIDDDGSEITVHLNGITMGSITLHFYEEDHHAQDYYHITNLSLDKCKHIGIGRQCLIFHKECFDLPLTAGGRFEGVAEEDGSHLTGDGVGFIAKMRKEGIVEGDSQSDYNMDKGEGHSSPLF